MEEGERWIPTVTSPGNNTHPFHIDYAMVIQFSSLCLLYHLILNVFSEIDIIVLSSVEEVESQGSLVLSHTAINVAT